MAPRKRRIPKYRHYKPKNLGVVRIDGRDHYLGKYDSPESREEYHRLIADWLRDSQSSPSVPVNANASKEGTDLTVNELILQFYQFAKQYYLKNGEPTGEADNIRLALIPLRRLYGSTAAKNFGPDALEAVQHAMINDGLSRTGINQDSELSASEKQAILRLTLNLGFQVEGEGAT